MDALVRDAHAALGVLHGLELTGALAETAGLLALVAGQDVEAGQDGIFRIVRKVARDRVISVVDTEARHGHKSRARTFDGFMTRLNVDPDDELITNDAVTAANTQDREVVEELLDEPGRDDTDRRREDGDADNGGGAAEALPGWEVHGDSAYADGQTLAGQAERGNQMHAKVPRYATATATPKTSSRSTQTPAPSPVLRSTPCRSARPVAAAGRPASGNSELAARCAQPARRLAVGE